MTTPNQEAPNGDPDLDRRMLERLRRYGEKGALLREIVDDLAARGTRRQLLAALHRLERADLVRMGERRGSEGYVRVAASEVSS